MAKFEKVNGLTENGVENVSVDAQDNAQVDTQEVVRELPKIILEEFKEKVKFKNYISLSDKTTIVDFVWNNCIVKDEINGIYYIDNLMKDVAFHLAILRYYTNFYEVYEYAEDYSYDELAEAGIFDCGEYHNSYNDISIVSDIVDYSFGDRVKAMNSTGASLHRLFNGLLEKLPDINEINNVVKELPEILNKVDPKVIEMFTKDLKNDTVKN